MRRQVFNSLVVLFYAGDDYGEEDDVSDKSSINETPSDTSAPTSPTGPEPRRDREPGKKPKSFLHTNKANHVNNNNTADVSEITL